MLNNFATFGILLLTSLQAVADTVIVDKSANDITVLQAWIGSTVIPAVMSYYGQGYKLDLTNCQTLERRPSPESSERRYFNVRVDCSDELKNVARLAPDNKPSPLLDKSIFDYIEVPESNSYYPSTGACETVEFRTIIRNSVLQNNSFAGVGFYLAPSDYYGAEITPIITPEQLHAVGQVILKDGSPATVHRFFMQGFCFGTGGNSSSIYSRHYQFRPFAAFTTTDSSATTAYRVWDDVAQNYILGRRAGDSVSGSFFVSSFDRQNDLLQ